MTEDPNRRPLTPPGDTRMAPEADRPAPGPDSAGEHGSTFPQDEGLEGQTAERPTEHGVAAGKGGAPQSVDPGLADQAPERPAERSGWGQDAAGEAGSTYPRDEALGKQATGLPSGGGVGAHGAPAPVDPGLADQEPEGPAERPVWGQGGASTYPRDKALEGQGTYRSYEPGGAAAAAGAAQPFDRGAVEQGRESGSDQAPMNRFREQWASVQGAFVDDPRNAIAEADRLVADVIRDVEQRLTRRREAVQGEWSRGEADTEQLRQLIHRYRALFHRLLETDF